MQRGKKNKHTSMDCICTYKLILFEQIIESNAEIKQEALLNRFPHTLQIVNFTQLTAFVSGYFECITSILYSSGNPFALLQAVIQLLKPDNGQSTSAQSTLTPAQECRSNYMAILDYTAPTMLHLQFQGLRSADHCLTQPPNAVLIPLYL